MGPPRLAAASAEKTYEQMAPFYDALTAHHDYGLYIGNLLPAVEAFGLQGRTLLDVGCGTGKSFLPLVEAGWEITGCDVSASMLAQAQAKAPSARLVKADMRSLPRLGSFALIWSLGDALNYLLSAEELARALDAMRCNLARGGLVAFDLNTLLTYRSFYSEQRVDECQGQRLVWQGGVAPDWVGGGVAKATMRAEDLETREQHVTLEHRQRHFTQAEVEGCLSSSGLEPLAFYGSGFDAVLKEPPDELSHTKTFCIARTLGPAR